MAALTIYCKQKSARLSYVLNWLFNERLGIDYTIVHSPPSDASFFISYGAAVAKGITIPDSGLLWKTGVSPQIVDNGNWKGIPTLFAGAEEYDIPFDIFSAIFFLLSRYEEYYSYVPDKHNRYPATKSVLFKLALLHRPIVDEWVKTLEQELTSKNISVTNHKFEYLPTYDIDIAWSYQHKGAKRSVGAFAKDILKGNFNNAQERLSTLSGSAKDPYDSFEWLDELHEQNRLAPLYFILCAEHTSAFDKNISPNQPAMQQLIAQLSRKYTLGIHPSYYMDVKAALLNEEKAILEKITNKPITISRQHYIKTTLPNTYQQLSSSNIAADYSMGYGTHLGFRAGTGCSFLWYDIENETTQHLRVHPFCFMDTTAHFEVGLSVQDAFSKLNDMKVILEKTGSRLTTVFHNFSLGTDKEWLGWSSAYAQFISECKP